MPKFARSDINQTYRSKQEKLVALVTQTPKIIMMKHYLFVRITKQTHIIIILHNSTSFTCLSNLVCRGRVTSYFYTYCFYIVKEYFAFEYFFIQKLRQYEFFYHTRIYLYSYWRSNETIHIKVTYDIGNIDDKIRKRCRDQNLLFYYFLRNDGSEISKTILLFMFFFSFQYYHNNKDMISFPTDCDIMKWVEILFPKML